MIGMENLTAMDDSGQALQKACWVKGMLAGGWIYFLIWAVIAIVLPADQTSDGAINDFCFQDGSQFHVFLFFLRDLIQYPGAWIMDQVFEWIWSLVGWEYAASWSAVEDFASSALTFAVSVALGAAITGGHARISKVAFLLAMALILSWQMFAISGVFLACILIH